MLIRGNAQERLTTHTQDSLPVISLYFVFTYIVVLELETTSPKSKNGCELKLDFFLLDRKKRENSIKN